MSETIKTKRNELIKEFVFEALLVFVIVLYIYIYFYPEFQMNLKNLHKILIPTDLLDQLKITKDFFPYPINSFFLLNNLIHKVSLLKNILFWVILFIIGNICYIKEHDFLQNLSKTFTYFMIISQFVNSSSFIEILPNLLHFYRIGLILAIIFLIIDIKINILSKSQPILSNLNFKIDHSIIIQIFKFIIIGNLGYYIYNKTFSLDFFFVVIIFSLVYISVIISETFIKSIIKFKINNNKKGVTEI